MIVRPRHLSHEAQQCFQRAEESLRLAVGQKYHDLNEEMITHLFWCELRLAAKEANSRGVWSHALSQDLSAAFHHQVSSFHFHSIADGLICDVHMHNHHREGITGGDFGLLVSSPRLVDSTHLRQEIKVEFCDTGLLVQAKLKKSKSYGRLQPSQTQAIASRADLFAFVLYSYDDEHRSQLLPFEWTSCAQTTESEIRDYLRVGRFPATLSSQAVLQEMFEGRLGTSDKSAIKEFIQTEQRKHPVFEFTLRWPRGQGPEKQTVKLSDFVAQKAQQQITLRSND